MEKYLAVLGYIAESGIEVRFINAHQVSIGGFYKSGNATVDFEKGTIETRYNTIDTFESVNEFFREITEVNRYWHTRSADRDAGWANMDPTWEKLELEAMHNEIYFEE